MTVRAFSELRKLDLQSTIKKSLRHEKKVVILTQNAEMMRSKNHEIYNSIIQLLFYSMQYSDCSVDISVHNNFLMHNY